MQSEELKELRKEVKAGRGKRSDPTSDSSARSTSPIEESQILTSLNTDIKSNDGFNLLGALLETAFFYSLFEYIADRQFASKNRPLRVAKMRSIHPRIYKWCIRLDVVVRIIVVVIIVIAATYSVYKVLR